MIDARLAIIILGSLGVAVVFTFVVSLFTAWLTGISALDIVNTILQFFYKIWDSILSMFQTMTFAAPAIIKLIFFVALFWTFGSFILSATVGVTHVCDPIVGRQYALSYDQGIAYAFLPDQFDLRYELIAHDQGTVNYKTGILGLGGTKFSNITSNVIDLSDSRNPRFLVPATDRGDILTKWINKKNSPAWTGTKDYSEYPVVKFSLCRRTRLEGVEQDKGQCVLWSDAYLFGQDIGSSCEQLNNDYSYFRYSEVWSATYRINYYHSDNVTNLYYSIDVLEDECVGHTTLIHVGPINIGWDYNYHCPDVLIDKCIPSEDSDNLTIKMRLSGIGNPAEGSQSLDMWNLESERTTYGGPDHPPITEYVYSRNVVGDSHNMTVTSNGTTKSGIVYNAVMIGTDVAMSSTGGGLLSKPQRSLFMSDNVHTYAESKVQFLEDLNESIPDKSKLVYWDCMQQSDGSYQSNAEIYIARLPVFSNKFMMMLVIFTVLFAVLGFINSLKGNR